MAVAFIAGNGGATSLSLTCDTGTITIGAQPDKALIAIVTWNTPVGATISSVVWDPTGANQAMTAVAAASTIGNRSVRAYRLINPTAVTNGIVRATFNDSTIGSQAVFAAAFSGAHQTTPAQDYNSANGTSTSPSVTIANATSDDMVMDSLIAAAFTDGTPGANQTAIGAESVAGDVHWASYQDGADGGVMSWTLNSSDAWLVGGVRIVAAAATGTTITPGLGSQALTGRTLGCGLGIAMPDVP